MAQLQKLLVEEGVVRQFTQANFVGLLERGQRNPTLFTLESLATALKTSVSDLMAASERRQR